MMTDGEIEYWITLNGAHRVSMEKIVKCPICGTTILDDDYTECSYCLWGYTGIECLMDEREYDSYNGISQKEAKELLAQGKNVFGETLPKNRKQQ